MILAGLATKLAPYGLALKLGLLGVVFLVGLGSGCHWQATRDAGEIADLKVDLIVANGKVRAAADTLNGITAQTRAEAAAAKARAAENQALVADAKARAAQFLSERIALEGELEQAKRRKGPTCVAQMEAASCVPIE